MSTNKITISIILLIVLGGISFAQEFQIKSFAKKEDIKIIEGKLTTPKVTEFDISQFGKNKFKGSIIINTDGSITMESTGTNQQNFQFGGKELGILPGTKLQLTNEHITLSSGTIKNGLVYKGAKIEGRKKEITIGFSDILNKPDVDVVFKEQTKEIHINKKDVVVTTSKEFLRVRGDVNFFVRDKDLLVAYLNKEFQIISPVKTGTTGMVLSTSKDELIIAEKLQPGPGLRGVFSPGRKGISIRTPGFPTGSIQKGKVGGANAIRIDFSGVKESTNIPALYEAHMKKFVEENLNFKKWYIPTIQALKDKTKSIVGKGSILVDTTGNVRIDNNGKKESFTINKELAEVIVDSHISSAVKDTRKSRPQRPKRLDTRGSFGNEG